MSGAFETKRNTIVVEVLCISMRQIWRLSTGKCFTFPEDFRRNGSEIYSERPTIYAGRKECHFCFFPRFRTVLLSPVLFNKQQSMR